MNEFLKWLSSNSIATTALIIIGGFLCLSTATIFIIAFMQGREISFWPPKIGERKDSNGKIKKSSYICLLPELEARSKFDILEKFNSLNSLCLLGYNLPNLLRYIRVPIIESLKKGGIVRIIMVNPNSEAYNVMKKHTNFPDTLISNTKTGLLYAKNIKEALEKEKNFNGKFDIKLTGWIPSCSMILINANDDSGIGKITINKPALRQSSASESHLIIEKKEFPKEFQSFLECFESLWQNDSEVWDGTIPITNEKE